MSIRDDVKTMKMIAPALAASPVEVRNEALDRMAAGLTANKDMIFAANAADLKRAEEQGIAGAVIKRLRFDEGKLASVLDGLAGLAQLPDPVGKVQLFRELDEGLLLKRISCPIGVIGVIFEARPDALVQIASLCIKSGNCAVLKGGRETAETNRALFGIIKEAVREAGLPGGCLYQAEAHSEIDELLECEGDVDLLIPRGSNKFVRYIMDHTKIPVMGHADGVCHIYIDKDADLEKAIPLIIDAKTQYAAACNAVETLLIDRALPADFFEKLTCALTEAGVALNGTEEARQRLETLAKAADPAGAGENRTTNAGETADGSRRSYVNYTVIGEDDFHKEYLEYALSLKFVDGVEEAVRHINRYGSHHTDAILTENDETAAYFLKMVDSAGVYRNCSTRFADGFRYGFGAEVGISTSKLHARGPVGLEGLMTYKYELSGDGHIVGDYASGRRSFHHRDLQVM